MAARFEIRQATYLDAPDLQTLINSTPQPGKIKINFERYPDFFHGSHVVTTDPDIWVMVDTQENCLAGVFSIGSREVYVNGIRKRVRYGNDLRIHPDYQGGRTLVRLFKKYREIMKSDWMQTVILSDNEASLSTVGSGRAGLPSYYEYGALKTSMVYLNQTLKKPRKRSASSSISIRRATDGDQSRMQDFADRESKKRQFYPHYDFADIKQGNAYYRDLKLSDYFLAFDGDRLVGITGVWDQKAFKQTRFLAYSGGMQILRHVNNWQAKLMGGMTLPEAGETLEYLVLHCILINENDVDIFNGLFRFIFKEYANDGRYSSLVCGLSVDDPLNTVFDRYRKQVLSSRHFIASYGEDPRDQFDTQRQFYLEAARL